MFKKFFSENKWRNDLGASTPPAQPGSEKFVFVQPYSASASITPGTGYPRYPAVSFRQGDKITGMSEQPMKRHGGPEMQGWMVKYVVPVETAPNTFTPGYIYIPMNYVKREVAKAIIPQQRLTYTGTTTLRFS